MSNNAMSNEIDLDWLARNVHVWREGANYVCVNHTDGGYVFHEHNRNCAIWFTKDQWLARRAELQNKPSWADAPEWAEWLAKDSPDKDEESAWWWYADKPVAMKNTWQVSTDGRALMAASCHCDLGDWRDTLEKRPEEFKPFTSIEDNQEREMKQDNGWLERGELPPVGFECEMKRIDGRWCKAVTVGKDSGGRMVCELNDNGVFYASTSSAESFRPIRTERDALIEIISSNLSGTTGQVADAIIAAGFKLEAK